MVNYRQTMANPAWRCCDRCGKGATTAHLCQVTDCPNYLCHRCLTQRGGRCGPCHHDGPAKPDFNAVEAEALARIGEFDERVTTKKTIFDRALPAWAKRNP